MDTPSLEQVESEYRAALAGRQLTELDLTPLDRTGVPTHAVIRTDAAGVSSAVGYGETDQRARIGALGELSEGIFPDDAITTAEWIESSYADLVRTRGSDHVADPLELVLEAGSDYSATQPLIWASATRWRTGEQVFVPVEFLASKPLPLTTRNPHHAWLTTPISNGLGAGMSTEQAVAHGLLELVQRDGDTVSFRALDLGAVVDTDSLDDPQLDALIARIEASGIRVTVKFAADEFVPVLYCVGEDTHSRDAPPIAMSAIGEAAHPDPRVAARKAVLEFAASRARRILAFGDLDYLRATMPDYIAGVEARGIPGGQEPRALREMQKWCRMDHDELRAALDPIFLRRSVVTASDLTTARYDLSAADSLPFLLDRLSDFDVLVMRGADPDAAGIRTAKVIAPRIEVETLSYSRIGERVAKRLLDRGDDLIATSAGEGRARIRMTTAAEDRIGGPVWLDQTRLAEKLGDLYPLYREPSWHAAPMSL